MLPLMLAYARLLDPLRLGFQHQWVLGIEQEQVLLTAELSLQPPAVKSLSKVCSLGIPAVRELANEFLSCPGTTPPSVRFCSRGGYNHSQQKGRVRE